MRAQVCEIVREAYNDAYLTAHFEVRAHAPKPTHTSQVWPAILCTCSITYPHLSGMACHLVHMLRNLPTPLG